MDGKAITLPKEVTEKYKVDLDLTVPVQHFGGRWGIVDLRTLTPEQSEILVENGFPHIKRRNKKDDVA